LREALARSDLDFVAYDEPRRGHGGSAGEGSRLPRILRVASVSTAALVCGVIVVNALFLQDVKHPAPLMRVPDAPVAEPAAPLPAPRPVTAAPATAVQAPATPAKAGLKSDPIGDEISRLTSPAAADRKGRDAIGALIGSMEPNGAIMAAQKALLKLGYVVRADGVAGATTRTVVERYERDNGLPVHGELTPKLMRDLAAKSGIPAQ
jgi:hypothetical protein